MYLQSNKTKTCLQRVIGDEKTAAVLEQCICFLCRRVRAVIMYYRIVIKAD